MEESKQSNYDFFSENLCRGEEQTLKEWDYINMEIDVQIDEFINSFLEFEEKYKMFKIKINNKYIWHYLRIIVYNNLFEKEKFINSIRRDIQNKKPKKSLNYMWKKNIFCNQFLAHKRDILIISHGRKYRDGDKYYKCPYTYLLDKHLSMSHYILDGKTPDGNYELQRSHNILYNDIEEFIKIKHIQVTKESISKLEIENKIIDPIETYFEISISLDTKKKWLDYINFFINTRKYYINYYYYMLKRIKPKIILIAYAYGFERMVLCEIAHKFRIPVVELQHGTMGPLHLAYNFYKKMRLYSFPDYIFTFGQYEKKYTRFPIPDNHVIPVGYPELEVNYNKYKKKKSNKKIILFISQTLFKIAQFANIVAQNIDAEKYQIVFQLHPFEYSCWKSTIGKYLTHTNIRVVGSYNHTIYESIAQADWVVGNYSTVLIEAQMFDVKVAILKFDFYKVVSFLYQNGYAILVDSPEQLIKEIENDTFQPNREVSLFEKNSLEKMQKSIDKIIEINRK